MSRNFLTRLLVGVVVDGVGIVVSILRAMRLISGVTNVAAERKRACRKRASFGISVVVGSSVVVADSSSLSKTVLSIS